MPKLQKEYLQSAMFGFTDALVSTTGVIVGIATGTSNKEVVILVGSVTILVEAMSMGAGQFLSSESASQLSKRKASKIPFISGIIMFVSYFAAGLVPLLSVVVFPIEYSRNVAIIAALSCLLLIGYTKGKFVRVSPVRSALEVLVIGGLATAIGIIVGSLFEI
jgi:VIT1/CCC1 family predicted Fe2+/Mn2+ transporter